MRWRDVLQDSRQAVQAIVTSVRRQLRDAGERWQRTSFNAGHQVRVILFRECDRRGRKPLFDSKTVRKRENGSPTKTEIERHPSSAFILENGVSFEYSKPSGDLKMLGEMIFGSVAMSFQGATLKVHIIRSPPQLMISLICPAPTNNIRQDFDGASGSLEASLGSESSGPYSLSCVSHSVPMDVPGLCRNGSASDLLESLEQRSAESSLTHSSSYNSFQRRLLSSVSTSIEYGLGSRHDVNGSMNEGTPGGRKIKLGLGVLFLFPENDPDEEFMRFQEFFFTHAALVEGHVLRLSVLCQQSFGQKHSFVASILEGVQQLRNALQTLYCSPRLPRPPAWLALVDPSGPHRLHALHISSQLLYLIKHFDTKNTNFFVSTLLTAVLSGHLTWVSTVAPSSERPTKRPTCGHQYVRRESAQWLDSLAQSHPYNPLWLQLCDLYGGLGFPFKLCQTLVVGKRSDIILRCLYALSYFIRCSDVCDKLSNRSTASVSDLTMSNMHSINKSINLLPEDEESKKVVFLLGEYPLCSKSLVLEPELSASVNIVVPSQTDTSLGYGSLPNSLERSDSRGLSKERETISSHRMNDEASQKDQEKVLMLQHSKFYMREYNALRFQELSIECFEKTLVECEENEEGYHSMEDCPAQSCCVCLQHGALEMAMPRVHLEERGLSTGLGVSLLAGVSSQYSPDFCLQGLLSTRGQPCSVQNVMQKVATYSQGDVQTISIVADTDTWQVHWVKGGPFQNEKSPVSMSPLVAAICDSLLQMEQLNMTPEFCLMHLEDRLQELYFRSRSLSVFLNERPSISPEHAADILGLHSSDLPLLIAVASTSQL